MVNFSLFWGLAANIASSDTVWLRYLHRGETAYLYLQGWCMIKLLKLKSNFRFLTRGLFQIFLSLWRGQYQWQNVLYLFLKLLLKKSPNPNFSPKWKLRVQTGFVPLPVLPFLHCQRSPCRRQIWGEPLITLIAVNSLLADKGIDQPLTAAMIIPSPSRWMGDRCTQHLSKRSSYEVHRVVSVQPLSCTALHTAKQKEILCNFPKTMITREKERHLVQQLTQERKNRSNLKSNSTKQINHKL